MKVAGGSRVESVETTACALRARPDHSACSAATAAPAAAPVALALACCCCATAACAIASSTCRPSCILFNVLHPLRRAASSSTAARENRTAERARALLDAVRPRATTPASPIVQKEVVLTDTRPVAQPSTSSCSPTAARPAAARPVAARTAAARPAAARPADFSERLSSSSGGSTEPSV
eukprot:scaffold120900_cov36-Phaeocystis_antarctica.AAC.1